MDIMVTANMIWWWPYDESKGNINWQQYGDGNGCSGCSEEGDEDDDNVDVMMWCCW